MMDGRSEMHLSPKPVGSYDATLSTNLPASKTAAVRISRKPLPMTVGTAKQPLVTTEEAEVLENFPVWPTSPQKSAFSMALNSKARMHKLPSYVSVSTGSDRWNGDLALEDTDIDNTDETPLEKKHPYDTQPERSYWKCSWIWEILSAGASVCAFVAIIVVLNYYDERAIPTSPLGVTLNGLVSILATVSKAMMMMAIAAAIGQCRWLRFAGKRPKKLRELQVFDDASRGPLGSLMLLYHTRLKSLAVLGATLTIISLGFDPFVQSLIHTDVRTVYLNDTSANLTPVMSIVDPEDYLDGLSVSYRVAVVSALANNASSFENVPTCPSKNCTWPTYTTMKVCSNCKNITSWVLNRLGPDLGCTIGPLFPTYDPDGNPLDESDGEYQYTCLYELPKPFDNYAPMYSSEYGVYFNQPLVFSNAVSGSNASKSEAAALLGESDQNAPIALSATIRFGPYPGTDFQDAYLCSWSLCLDELSTRVEDGVTSDTTLNSMTLAAVQYNHNISQVQNIYQLMDEREMGATLMFSSQAHSPNQGSKGLEMNLTIGLDVWLGLEQSLLSYFTGTYTHGDSEVGINLENEPPAQDEILIGMTETTNFIAMMDRVASSLTKQMRTTSDLVVYGQAGSLETYIKIHWGWTALSAVVLAGGLVFLVVTIFETSRRGVEIWKGSSLPLLYNSRDGQLKHDEDSTTLDQMEHLADSTNVTLLRRSRDGWTFRVDSDERVRYDSAGGTSQHTKGSSFSGSYY